MKTMGIDLGIRKAAFSLLEDGVLIESDAYEAAPTHRCKELHYVSHYIYDAAASMQPDFVFIEEPLIGNNRKYSLNVAMTYGAVLSEIAYTAEIIGVNVGQWKRETVGKGNATKEMVCMWLKELDSAYPDMCGHDQDRIDATAIGYYGWRVAERAGRLVSESR